MTNVVLVTTEYLENLVKDIQEVKALLKKERLQNDLPELLRTSEVKRILKLSDSSLAALRQNGTLPFIKIAGSVYYKKEDIFRLMNNNYSGNHDKLSNHPEEKRNVSGERSLKKISKKISQSLY